MSAEPSTYGSLSPVVSAGAAAFAASLAIATPWLRRFGLKSELSNVASVALTVAGVVNAGVIVIVYTIWKQNGNRAITPILISFMIAGLVGALAYQALITQVGYPKPIGRGRRWREVRAVGGFRRLPLYTSLDQDQLKAEIERHNYDAQQIWTRGSLTSATVAVNLAVVLFVVGLTVVIACAGMLVSSNR
jgi:hypothetical protein